VIGFIEDHERIIVSNANLKRAATSQKFTSQFNMENTFVRAVHFV
jgi:hypothetical protein